jgi:hypothetical protein
VSQADFDRQAAFELNVVDAMRASFDGHQQAAALRAVVGERLASVRTNPAARAAADALKDFASRLEPLVGGGRGRGGAPQAGRARPAFAGLNGHFGALLEASDLADGAPTEAMRTAWTDYCRDLTSAFAEWNELTGKRLADLNAPCRRAPAADREAAIGCDVALQGDGRAVAPGFYGSRCTVSGENAGRQIATYSAPSGPGVL